MHEAEKKWLVTPKQMQLLKERLQHLITFGRAEVDEMIQSASKLGHLENNAEYAFAMEEKNRLEAEIRKLEDDICNCTVVDDHIGANQPNDGNK